MHAKRRVYSRERKQRAKKQIVVKRRENHGTPGVYKAVTERVMRVCDVLFYSLRPPKVNSLLAH